MCTDSQHAQSDPNYRLKELKKKHPTTISPVLEKTKTVALALVLTMMIEVIANITKAAVKRDDNKTYNSSNS